MNTIKFIDSAEGYEHVLLLPQSSLIPLQLSSHFVYTSVGSDNCMTEPVERKSQDVGDSSA
jgi:hypothetical protein